MILVEQSILPGDYPETAVNGMRLSGAPGSPQPDFGPVSLDSYLPAVSFADAQRTASHRAMEGS
jgi:hypothetical protein